MKQLTLVVTTTLLVVFAAATVLEAQTIRDNPGYYASTGLTLGATGSEWGGSTGFVMAAPFQINLEYQAGVLNSAIDAINAYDPDGSWTANFDDEEEYVLKIDAAGSLPIYTYPDGEEAGGANIQWTLTGWHQTILAGDIIEDTGSVYLRVLPGATYRPFPNDPPVNDVEIFDGNMKCEILGYTFTGNLEDIGEGSVLGVDLVPEPATMLAVGAGLAALAGLRRKRR